MDYFPLDRITMKNLLKMPMIFIKLKCLTATILVLYATTVSGVDEELVQHARTAIQRATTYLLTISTNGGYVGIYSADLSERYGEAFYEKASATEIWVQPPGTPSVGESFLRAYRVTEEKSYLLAARKAGRALAWGQREEGGWDHRVDVAHLEAESKWPERRSGRCTFDDDISQGALTFLMNLDEELDESWLDDSIKLALNFIMEAQFDNGAWPQWFPLRGGYHDYYTFNDDAINDCIRVMLKAHRRYGESKYLECALRGGDFIIASQLMAPQSGWAQQYSHDMKPAWARTFEPPGVCSRATIANIRTLYSLYQITGDGRYLQPVSGAFDWLENSNIGPNKWSRLYELGTNRPIYGDRDSLVHYTLQEISEERRNGYGWQSDFDIPKAILFYKEYIENEPVRLPVEGNKQMSEHARLSRATSMESEVRQIISGLDDQGRWIDDGYIRTATFVNNMNILCSYLEL